MGNYSIKVCIVTSQNFERDLLEEVGRYLGNTVEIIFEMQHKKHDLLSTGYP